MIEALTHWLADTASPEETHGTKCACCGLCCESFGSHLNVSKQDRERWQRQGRDDLLCRINRLDWIWMNPLTGLMEDTCPFLVKGPNANALCSIHDTKPAICRDYPTMAHGHRCLRGVFLKF